MIKEFEYYVKNNLIKKGSPDFANAKSLIKKAEGRIKFSILSRKISEQNSSYIFEEIYECLREAVQALMSLKGYKPYSHEVLVSFLKEFYNFEESNLQTFNRCRVLRNKSVYGCETISKQSCIEALNFLKLFFPKIKREILNK